MTKLPPLANLLTIRDENPQSLAALTASLKAHSDFDTVFHPAPHWVCAQKYLPDSEPDPPEARATSLVFCEGRDEIESGHEHNTRARFESLAAKLQSAPQSLHEFPGDFGFLHFSPDGAATAVRSCGTDLLVDPGAANRCSNPSGPPDPLRRCPRGARSAHRRHLAVARPGAEGIALYT